MTLSKGDLTDLIQKKHACADAALKALNPTGHVLLIGFSDGYAATKVLAGRPKSLVIVEEDASLEKKGQDWLRLNNASAKITWKRSLASLGEFDEIFFDGLLLEKFRGSAASAEAKEFASMSNEAQSVLKSIDSFLAKQQVRFSDKQIDDFLQKIGKDHQQDLPLFFEKLKGWGYISLEQFQKAKAQFTSMAGNQPSATPTDPLLGVLETCLKAHMHKGSRFAALLGVNGSKFEDAPFFERIITNSNLDYQEESTSSSNPSLWCLVAKKA